MQYKKLFKKGVLSVLLAGTLVVTGVPVIAEDSMNADTAWEYGENDSSTVDSGINDVTADQENAEQMPSESQTQGFAADGQEETGVSDNSDGMTTEGGFQSEDTVDGFVDGGIKEAESGFGSMDPDDPSPVADGQEDTLTEAEIEAQLEPIRELSPLSYVDPPSGSGNEETGSVGAARAASYPARYDPRSSLSLPVRNQKPSNMCWAYTLAANLEIGRASCRERV